MRPPGPSWWVGTQHRPHQRPQGPTTPGCTARAHARCQTLWEPPRQCRARSTRRQAWWGDRGMVPLSHVVRHAQSACVPAPVRSCGATCELHCAAVHRLRVGSWEDTAVGSQLCVPARTSRTPATAWPSSSTPRRSVTRATPCCCPAAGTCPFPWPLVCCCCGCGCCGCGCCGCCGCCCRGCLTPPTGAAPAG